MYVRPAHFDLPCADQLTQSTASQAVLCLAQGLEEEVQEEAASLGGEGCEPSAITEAAEDLEMGQIGSENVVDGEADEGAVYLGGGGGGG